ncbi:MAG: hypothetical protein FJW23_01070 [Acidimicrobiia bacterium]|nr:hypothetical protein [Acidimicrobiia bacterium]
MNPLSRCAADEPLPGRRSRLCSRLLALALGLASTGLLATVQDVGSGSYSRGLNVVPVYEGWRYADDGSIEMLFGYLNRNWDQAIDVAIGPDNTVEPGGPDRGQPTHFLSRRGLFVFAVRVPADFGANEVVWTLTSAGRTQRAYGTTKPGYFIDNGVIAMNHGGGSSTGPENLQNRAPELAVAGPVRLQARVGQPLTLEAVARDDGIPRTRSLAPLDPRRTSGLTVTSATGLRLAWFVYRGSGSAVVFNPAQFKVNVDMRDGSPWTPGWQVPPVPPDSRWTTRVTFHEPGQYILRCLAHDGMLPTYHDVEVTVS